MDKRTFLAGVPGVSPLGAPAAKSEAAATAGWCRSTSSKCVDPYFDPNDPHCRDRELFGSLPQL